MLKTTKVEEYAACCINDKCGRAWKDFYTSVCPEICGECGEEVEEAGVCIEPYGIIKARKWASNYDDIKPGDWVLYKGKPRQVYKFFPFGGPNCSTPEIERDPRFDMIEVLGLKALVYVRDVQRMTVEEVTE